ncbi:MAG: isoprenylcysteine carboxylmethyltransferase family protein [Saprospiraceae bacterium]|nr:isoprenylcysteine carboxylmethyltransferase family protein [Saprospiraceae bacterium]
MANYCDTANWQLKTANYFFMNRFITYAFTLFSYLITGIVLICFVGFFQNFFVPKQISTNVETGIDGKNVFWDFGLILLFGIQHSIMARDWFKKWWTNLIPKQFERVFYNLISSFILAIIIWQWQPINVVVWDLRGSAIAVFLYGISILGLCITAISIFSLDAADFSGWKQVKSIGNEAIKPTLQTPLFYKIVRHPIYFGFLISFWANAVDDHRTFVFAIILSAYIFIGATLEERNLSKTFGLEYTIYQQEVAMLIPFLL